MLLVLLAAICCHAPEVATPHNPAPNEGEPAAQPETKKNANAKPAKNKKKANTLKRALVYLASVDSTAKALIELLGAETAIARLQNKIKKEHARSALLLLLRLIFQATMADTGKPSAKNKFAEEARQLAALAKPNQKAAVLELLNAVVKHLKASLELALKISAATNNVRDDTPAKRAKREAEQDRLFEIEKKAFGFGLPDKQIRKEHEEAHNAANLGPGAFRSPAGGVVNNNN